VEATSNITTIIASRDVRDLGFVITVLNPAEIAGRTDYDPNDFTLQLFRPDGTPTRFVERASSSGTNRIAFYPFVDTELVGTYTWTFLYNNSALATASGTPTSILVRYDTVVEIQFPPQVGEGNYIRTQISLADGSFPRNMPFFELQGARIDPRRTTYLSGFLHLYIDEIVSAGPGALRLFIEGSLIRQWDVASEPFATFSFSPGELVSDTPMQLQATASFHDHLRGWVTLETGLLHASLSGVPILRSSVNYNDPHADPNSDVFNFVSLPLHQLSSVVFAGGGTLQVTLYNQGFLHQSTFSVPVRTALEQDVLGAPAVLSHAGDNSITLSLRSPATNAIVSYWADFNLPDGSTVELHNFAVGTATTLPTVNFVANGSGTLSYSVTCLDRSMAEWTRTRSFSFNLPKVTLSQEIIPLGSTTELRLTLEDENGVAVRGAHVFISGVGRMVEVSGESGVYSISTTWNTPGFLRLEARGSDGRIYADFANLLYVQPNQDLRLTVDNDKMLAGVEQLMRLNVYEGERELSGAAVRFTVIADGIDISRLVTSAAAGGFTLRTSAWNKITIFATSANGRQVSNTHTIEALLPIVQSNHNSFASGYRFAWELEFFDPRSGEPLAGTISIRNVGTSSMLRDRTSNGAGNHNGSAFGMNIWARLNSGVTSGSIAVDFSVANRDYFRILSLDVAEATVSFDPNPLLANARQDVTVTVLAPDATPLQGVMVRTVVATETKTTNAQGQATFNLRTTANEHAFHVLRDDAILQGGSSPSLRNITVPVIADLTGPTFSIVGHSGNYVETSETPYLLQLEFNDDFALDSFTLGPNRHSLNGRTDAWSGRLNLAVGINEFALSIRDLAGNVTEHTLRILYTPQAPPPPVVEISSGIVTMTIDSLVIMHGEERLEAPPLPPQIIGGRTMLPFRYLVQTVLGGSVEFDAETRRIFATVKEVEIEMQVDNPLIYVDGVEVLLDVAPIVIAGSTLVPLRAFAGIVRLDWDGDTQTVTINLD
jgi:hypothetical protein